MSWQFVAAAWLVRLTPTQKLVLLALSNMSDPKGRVLVSNRELRRLTGLSEQSVRRSLRQLAAAALGCIRCVNRGFASDSSRYQLLHLRGATVVGGAKMVGGAKQQGGEVPNRDLSSDPLQIPKSIKAEPAAPAPSAKGLSRREEIPTRDQVTKLVHVLLDDPVVEIRERRDLEELVKTACARADFVYNTPVVDDGIKRALAARGINPDSWKAADLQQARRRRHS